MIGDISLATNIYIITGYTDMRRSIDGLYAIIMDMLGEEPDQTSIYLFCGKRCDRIKALLSKEDGFVLLYKRLENGKYKWPRVMVIHFSTRDSTAMLKAGFAGLVMPVR